MTKEDLLPFIEIDTDRFWLNSVSSTNSDSVFLQHGIDDEIRALNIIRKTPANLNIVNSFLKMNYLIKGEYFIGFMSNMLLTNRRLFIWFSDMKKSIPLQKLIRYENAKWDSGIIVEYLEGEAIQTFKLFSKWLDPQTVNNALNKHRYVKVSEEELILTSNLKPTLDSSYNILLENEILSVEPVINPVHEITTNNTSTETQPNVNYNALFKLCLLLLFLGGCIYYYSKSDTNSNNTIVNSSSSTGSKKVKCTWCGGIGRVGYAGESKAQVDRTGMGLGNPCNRCNGSGYMDENADK